jgi:hypothetical protein
MYCEPPPGPKCTQVFLFVFIDIVIFISISILFISIFILFCFTLCVIYVVIFVFIYPLCYLYGLVVAIIVACLAEYSECARGGSPRQRVLGLCGYFSHSQGISR